MNIRMNPWNQMWLPVTHFGNRNDRKAERWFKTQLYQPDLQVYEMKIKLEFTTTVKNHSVNINTTNKKGKIVPLNAMTAYEE
jgi:hypothetical protein